MDKNKNRIDIISKILQACYEYNSDALFVLSLMHQYEERGSLSRKQLQGLHLKASKIKTMPSSWLATLEATILKMPVRDKTPVQENKPTVLSKNESIGKMITDILAKYPQHKRVLFLQTKYLNNENISITEVMELEKFKKLLLQ
jgi:DNA-binding LacI/PurR family transcriptional regulator